MRTFSRAIVRASSAAALLCVASLPAHATMPARSGVLPEPVIHGFQSGLFAVPEPSSSLSTSSNQAFWRVPIILASFADDSVRYSPSDFDQGLFDTTRSTPDGSVFDYYRWVSSGRLTVTGRVVATVRLPHESDYYSWNSWGLSATSTPNNSFGAIRDALMLCQTGVDWSEFDQDRDGYVDMLWLIHAGVGGEASRDRNHLWSMTSRMSAGWRDANYFTTSDPVPGSATQHMRIDRFSIVPELSAFKPGARSEIGVFCHEFGHALGLPDLYDTSNLGVGNVGPGNWSLMSSGAYGGDGLTPQSPVHLGAWEMQFLGWDRTVFPSQDTLISLGPLETTGSVVEWWFQGESNAEHFLIENRQRQGFDKSLLGEGMLITHVDEAVIGQHLGSNTINAGPTPGLRLVEADGNDDMAQGRNRGDSGDIFPGSQNRTSIDDDSSPSARMFDGSVTNMALHDIRLIGNLVQFQAQVRAPGWLAPLDYSGADFRPIQSYGPARVAGIDEKGRGYWVESELRSGRPQVVLRSSDRWSDTYQVSNSPAAALDPALALLPGGDLAIVWSDSRSGRSRLYYRSRIGGIWTDERQLVSLPGECRHPAIAVDRRGTISLAFQCVEGEVIQIRYMRFTYFSPFGQSVRLTRDTEIPGTPGVAIRPDGLCYVLWIDRADSRSQVWYSRCHPDSVPSIRAALTPSSPIAQTAFTAVCDTAGTLHTVWLASGPGASELHYQRMPKASHPWPADTLLGTRGNLVENPTLAIDGQDGLHLVFDVALSSATQIYYRSWRPGRGWDARSTEVTFALDGAATRPQVLPAVGGNVDVLYLSSTGSGWRLMLRRRQLTGSSPLAVALGAASVYDGLRVGPNPLRTGTPLEIAWSGAENRVVPTVDFFDLSGRRLASVPLRGDGATWRGRLEPFAFHGWPSGVYFARLRASVANAARIVYLQ